LKKQLEQCNKEAEQLKKNQLGQIDDELMASVLLSFGDEKNELAYQNEQLKARIQQLEKELGNLNKPAEPNTL
jgi:transcription elongation GreA/GreB family factor